jgi:hypothetical protein
MAEQILPPNMAALLAPPDPQQQRLITLAALARAGALNEAPPIPSMSPPAMPPTLSGAENAPPVPPRSLSQMGFAPPRIEGTPGGAMPSPAEAADIAESARWAGGMATEAAPFAIAGPIARGIGYGMGRAVDLARRFPEAVTGLGAMGGMAALLQSGEPTPVEAQRRPAPSEAIKALQRQMQDEGLYSGPIDGILDPNGPTFQAKQRYDALLKQRAEQRKSEMDAELAKTKSETERESLRLQQEKIKRDIAEGEHAAAQVAEGTRMLNEMQPSWIETWGPRVATLAGVLKGGGERAGFSWLLGKETRELSKRASGMAAEMGQGEVPQRVARVNELWREGAPGSQAPFTFQPGRQPYPWTTNQQAAAPNELFGPPSGLRGAFQNYGPLGLTLGGAGAEMGLGASWLSDAKEQLKKVEDDIAKPNGSTPANVKRLQQAREAVANAEFMIRMGFFDAVGGVGMDLKSRLGRSRLRPSVQQADAERGKIDALLGAGAGGRLSAAEIALRRRTAGPLPGGHYVDPTAPPTPNEAWVSKMGNKMWTRDANGRFRDENGQLTSDPRVRRDWRRISQADEEPSSMAEFLQG